jgi:isoquinoline 1-oxidoreductase beta subunit
MKRRSFLLAGLGAGGALFLGWSLVPPRQRLRSGTPPRTGSGEVALNGWLAIAPDDTVTVMSPKAEMGQGIHTALAMLVAEELDCDWAKVRVVHSGIDRIYNNISAFVDALPFHEDQQHNPLVRFVQWHTAKLVREMGVMITAGSSSTRDVFAVAREAGATARMALVQSAAARWGVSVDACRTERGTVVHGERRLRYGELLADAAVQRPARVTLKPVSQFTLVGRDTLRLDAAEKSLGATTYGIDVRVPGLHYAAVALPPALGTTPLRYNRAAALACPGVKAVVPLTGNRYGDTPGVAVVADSWWRARQGVNALTVEWSASPHASLTTAGIMTTLRAAAAGDGGMPWRSYGDAHDAIAGATTQLDVTYEAPYLAHVAMEPPNATVRVGRDAAELWVGTQVPGYARDAVALVTQLDASRVTVHQHMMGGSFGRRLDVDFIAQAAAIAKAVPDVPVQLIWSREDDLRNDFYRPAAVSRLRGGLDANGHVTGIVAHSASQIAFQAVATRVGLLYASVGPDRYTAEGSWDQPYEFAALRSAHVTVDLPVPTGSWRSVGHSLHGFFIESFIDELAHAARQDAVAFRLSLLTKHPRAAAVLRLAADRSGWSTPLAPGSDGAPRARGVALHWMSGTTVAHVVELSHAASTGVRVHKVVTAIDCGVTINPAGIRQQVEGAILDGITSALRHAVDIDQGRVRQGNLHEYLPLRMGEALVVDIHIVQSAEPPGGVGEPALPPVAPAIANALFALTGQRLRTLPLRVPTTTGAA